MPRPVVPMALPPAAFSRAWSRAMWYGMIRGVAGLIFSRERTSTPASSSSPISLISAAGESTTPLPIRHSASSRRMPEGIRCSTVFLPPITSVWPALWPPWKRTTAPMSCVRRSTILPLPSSPTCQPCTTHARTITNPPLRTGGATPPPVAVQAQRVVAQDARGDQVQHGLLAADHQRVAGVVAALEAHHRADVLRQQVDDLALALVAPLRAEHHH